MSRAPRPVAPLERSRHRAYETVRADALNAHEATEETLRSWHNRALHATYGVSFGFDVEPDFGALAAKVRPGLAYDATGRDLLVGETTLLPLPPDPKGMTLVVRAGEPRPTFGWVPTDGFRISAGIPLARTLADPWMLDKVSLAPLPPSLPTGKYTYDDVKKSLTIRGLITRDEAAILIGLAGGVTATENVIRSGLLTWPFDAPRPSRARGLQVEVRPFDRQDMTAPVSLWQAVIQPGSALSPSGKLITLTKPLTISLAAGSDALALILNDGVQAGERVQLRPGSSAKEDEFILTTLSLPDDTTIVLDEDNPIDETTLLEPARTQTIKAALDDLVNKKKITYQRTPPAQITITGLLTQDEAETIANSVKNSDISRDNALERLDNLRDENRPIRPPTAVEGERIPLFPPRSRPLARPRVATGLSLPGRTEWKLRTAADVGLPQPGAKFSAYEATVTIESAGFTVPPQVFTWAERVESADPAAAKFPILFQGGVVGTLAGDRKTYAPIDTRTFIFRVWTVDADKARDALIPGKSDATLGEWLLQNLYVRWLAVQPDPVPNWEQWPGPDVLPERIWP